MSGGFTKQMGYDNQLIFCLVPGGTHRNDENKGAYTNARNLSIKRQLAGEKTKSELVTLQQTGKTDLSKYQNKIGINTRVYIVGHGTAESSSIGGLDADQLADMIKNLVGVGKKIKRLGLVGCFTGQSEFPTSVRPLHRLAAGLFEKVSGQVVEITGYTGSVTTTMEYYAQRQNESDVEIQFGGRTVFATHGTGHKVVSGGGVWRKFIVDFDGGRWAPQEELTGKGTSS